VEMNVSSLGERLVKVSLVGRLDTPGVASVESRFVAHLVPGANSAIVDLSQVDFVASMGLRMLVATAKDLKARQAKLVLYGAQRPVLQVFEAVALNTIIPIYSEETDALAAIGAPPVK
jgi:anti-anti-sigma factor